MTKEELEKERFIKSYPEFCCNGKPLSPFWDLWQAGAEFGYQEAQKKKQKSALNSLAEAIETWR